MVRYCISENNSENKFACNGNAKLTFELALSNISGENLLQWNAAMDTVDNDQRHLFENGVLLKNHVYCNCSSSYRKFYFLHIKIIYCFSRKFFFGEDSSYSFDTIYSDSTFDEIIFNEYDRKESLEDEVEIINTEHLLMCYEGLKCNSTICLDWRRICDDFYYFENSEDEFEDCFLIEINQCKENEYRCLNGISIPKTYLIDMSDDCRDMTDEEYSIDDFTVALYDCSESTLILCDYSQPR